VTSSCREWMTVPGRPAGIAAIRLALRARRIRAALKDAVATPVQFSGRYADTLLQCDFAEKCDDGKICRLAGIAHPVAA
jgi:hypothetical protein